MKRFLTHPTLLAIVNLTQPSICMLIGYLIGKSLP